MSDVNKYDPPIIEHPENLSVDELLEKVKERIRYDLIHYDLLNDKQKAKVAEMIVGASFFSSKDEITESIIEAIRIAKLRGRGG
jgi:hypothetical protein